MSAEFGLRLLETLTSALYEEPIVLFREYVQNSVDAFVREPVDNPRIDIEIDRKRRVISFVDNGHGICEKLFMDKMRTIGRSEKSHASDQIGFRGIGRLSAMPFCRKLVFKNKEMGKSFIDEFSWNGEKYNFLLAFSEEKDLKEAIDVISEYHRFEYDGDSNDHFFKVELQGYKQEIVDLVKRNDFKERLSRLLPLKYSPEFSFAKEIHNHYHDYMGKKMDTFEFDVYLDNEPLFKPYKDEHILESDIVFWDLKLDPVNDSKMPIKIGVLWFTFNRKVTANKADTPRGIFVRSKNMLMGDEYAIASAVSKGNNEYISTYRELTQTLSGVYGELLLDTDILADNARRDWFRIDPASTQLRYLLSDYMKTLVDFRYAASKAFNDKKTDEKKTSALRENVINAYKDLTSGSDWKRVKVDNFNPMMNQPPIESPFIYADEDIPRYSIANKKFYEELLELARSFFVENEKDGIERFIKLRTYIKQNINK